MENKEVRRTAFVLRIWQDEDGHIYGHIQEPMSGWQRPFTGVDDLCQLLLDQMSNRYVKGDNGNEQVR